MIGTAIEREVHCFDSIVESEGDFNPFHPRGWETLRRRFREMVPIAGQMRVLDVGCGTGRSRFLYVERPGAPAEPSRPEAQSGYAGVDLSSRALRCARGRFPASTWLRADGCRMPLASGTFDVVAFSSVLHHMKDFAPALKEARRVLRPGGYAFAFDPNLIHPAMAAFRHPRSPLYCASGVSPGERPVFPRALARAFRKAGFTDVRQRCQADIPYRAVAPKALNFFLPVYNICDRLLEAVGLGRWLGSFVLTVGRKAPDEVVPRREVHP